MDSYLVTIGEKKFVVRWATDEMDAVAQAVEHIKHFQPDSWWIDESIVARRLTEKDKVIWL